MESIVLVSVILPSYNVAPYIRQCVESVMRQTLPAIEILCVDAGSTDGTLEIIEELAQRDCRIHVVHSDKKSYGYQVNLGIRMAKGAYIGIVETDDYILPEMYEKLYRHAISLNADVVKGPYYEDSGKVIPAASFQYLLTDELPTDTVFSLKEHPKLLALHASVWAGIYKRDYLLRNDIRFVEAPGAGYVDVDFRARTMMETNRLSWYPEPLYCYRTDAVGSSTSKFNLPVMIQRWSEEHQRIPSFQEDYNQYYGKYWIYDEFRNTTSNLFRLKFTESEYEGIRQLMSHVPEAVIKESPMLTFTQKRFLMAMNRGKIKRVKFDIFYLRMFYRCMDAVFPIGSDQRRQLKKSFFRIKQKLSRRSKAVSIKRADKKSKSRAVRSD